MERLVLSRVASSASAMHGKRSSEARHSPSNRLTGAQAESPAAGRPLSGLAGRAGMRGTVGPAAGRRGGMAVAAPAFCPPAARLAKAPDAPSRISESRTTNSGHAVALARGRASVSRDARKSFDGHDPDRAGEEQTDQRGLAGLPAKRHAR